VNGTVVASVPVSPAVHTVSCSTAQCERNCRCLSFCLTCSEYSIL